MCRRGFRMAVSSVQPHFFTHTCSGNCGTSFWNAMILRSAKELGCGIVHSEDLSPGQEYEGVLVRNPCPD
jgi:predicted nucleic acid-binding protein